ncbi:polycystin-2 isoform X2 [Diorhabda carinulata]|nr:polycystin-2 isoform X2 [Diorhabda carinulata]XP_057670919.1 polycystin-2 isoform X2 [Diorhabda carinulata]
MIDSIFWESTYAIVDEKHKNRMNILQENRVLGVPRMRQLKVRNDSCIIHEYFRKFFLTCYGGYSEASEDKEEFGPRNGTAWMYSSAGITKNLPYRAKVSTYGGGGYYLDFIPNKEETQTEIQMLKENLWVTRGTRAIFVDLSVYNGNLNVFGTVKLIFEYPTAGGVIPSADIQAVKLLRFHSTWDWVGLVCEVCCYAFMLYYILEEIREIMYFGLRYFRRFWNYIDLSIIALLVTGLIMSLFIMLEVPPAIKKIKKNPKEYGNLEYVSQLYIRRNNVIAVALYLIYLKAFKFLNFNRTMGQLNNTLNKCALDILGFSMMFFIVFFAYSELGYLLFGNQVENFSTFGISMLTLLRAVLGDFNYEQISDANRILAPMYFISYIFLVFFVLLNMFLAIINDTYADVKTEIAIAPNEMQMTEYITKKFGKFLRKIGLGRFIPKHYEEKAEINATIREIREVLKKCGFNDLEIEMFFARYNIDPWSELRIKDSDKLLEELTLILKQDGDEGNVKVTDFIRQQKQLQEIEVVIQKLVEQVKTLLQKLEGMENVTREEIR